MRSAFAMFYSCQVHNSSFNYPHRSMVTEPLLLVSAFFLLYLVTIIYVRLDFSISQDEGAEAKMKVQ